MGQEQHHSEEKIFVEEVGLFFEQWGLSRMAGRLLGWLLISDPPYQSANELTEVLMASKGSISTTTRLLIHMGLIERQSLPGKRRSYFQIKLGAWDQMLKDSLRDLMAVRLLLAERGLKLLEGKPPELRKRLEDMLDAYTFFEREFPALLERREQERKEANRWGKQSSRKVLPNTTVKTAA